MNEIWKTIKEYENYSVSDSGLIKNNKTNRFLILSLDKYGYLNVGLFKDGKAKTFKVHQIVAINFLNHTPCGYEKVINHIDGIKTNNNVNNLEIVTSRMNNSFCYKSNKHLFSSKYEGVSFFKRDKKWKSKIFINNKSFHLGYHENEIKAHEIYCEAVKNFENGTFETWYLTLNIKQNSTSKHKGVYYRKDANKWVSGISINNKKISFGLFNSELEAYEARENFLKSTHLN